jgi:hypothetical protein
MPIGAVIKRLGKCSQLTLVFCVAVEIFGGSERAGDQVRTINRRDLGVAEAPTCFHVEKVIVETVVADRFRMWSLWSIDEEPQARQCTLHCFRPLHVLPFDGDRIRSECKTNDRYRRG